MLHTSFFTPDTSSRRCEQRPRPAVNRQKVRAFFAMPQKVLIDLPADVVQHILVRIQLAHHIGRAAPTCKVVSVAAGTTHTM